jgi:hypothetical protein
MLAERFTLDELGSYEVAPIQLADLMDRYYVGVVER